MSGTGHPGWAAPASQVRAADRTGRPVLAVVGATGLHAMSVEMSTFTSVAP